MCSVEHGVFPVLLERGRCLHVGRLNQSHLHIIGTGTIRHEDT